MGIKFKCISFLMLQNNSLPSYIQPKHPSTKNYSTKVLKLKNTLSLIQFQSVERNWAIKKSLVIVNDINRTIANTGLDWIISGRNRTENINLRQFSGWYSVPSYKFFPLGSSYLSFPLLPLYTFVLIPCSTYFSQIKL